MEPDLAVLMLRIVAVLLLAALAGLVAVGVVAGEKPDTVSEAYRRRRGWVRR